MKSIINHHLHNIHSGSIVERLTSTFTLSFMLSPAAIILDHINEWYFENFSYVVFTFIAVIFDHLLGSYVHAFINRDFSMKKNIFGFFTKMFLVIIVGVLAEGVAEIMQDNIVADYSSIVARLMVFIYPAGSAWENSRIITNGRFPPIGFMDWAKKINETFGKDETDEKL